MTAEQKPKWREWWITEAKETFTQGNIHMAYDWHHQMGNKIHVIEAEPILSELAAARAELESYKAAASNFEKQIHESAKNTRDLAELHVEKVKELEAARAEISELKKQGKDITAAISFNVEQNKKYYEINSKLYDDLEKRDAVIAEMKKALETIEAKQLESYMRCSQCTSEEIASQALSNAAKIMEGAK